MSFVEKMRFLSDDGELYPDWKEKKLGDVAQWHNGYAFKPKDLSKRGTTVVKIKEMLDQKDLKVKTELTNIPEHLVLTTGDIILSWSMTIDVKKWFGGYAYLNQHLYKVDPNLEDLNKDFALYLVKNNLAKLSNLAHGGTAKHITRPALLNFLVSLPSLPEQSKIADFLSNLDERIDSQSKLVELLKEQKAGYSQRIFNGSLRFKKDDGTDYPDWEEKKLRDVIAEGGSGGTPSSTNKKYYGDGFPFLSIADISKQGKYLKSTEKNITKEGIKNSSAWVIPSQSLIYAMYASIGKMTINNAPITTSQALYSIKFDEETNLEFMYYALIHFNAFGLRKFTTKGTQSNINAHSLKSFILNLPSLPEQEKIANFLSSLDNRIDEENNKLTQLQQEKNAYMQKVLG